MGASSTPRRRLLPRAALNRGTRPADHEVVDTPPSPRQQLEQLLPPAPALDTATLTSGLGDAAARESVARLLTQLTRERRAA